MGTSERTFNQVKAILGKLDRSIDEARERRLKPEEAPATQPTRERPFGRATPLPTKRPNTSGFEYWGG